MKIKLKTILVLTFTLLIMLVCILVMMKNNNFKTYGSLDITIYNRDMEKGQGFTLEEFLSSKKIISFNLTGNEIEDNKIFKVFQSEIKVLVNSNDSIKCIHLKLSKKSKYKDFIKAIEICEREKTKVYVPFGYDFYVTNPATNEFKKSHQNSIP